MKYFILKHKFISIYLAMGILVMLRVLTGLIAGERFDFVQLGISLLIVFIFSILPFSFYLFSYYYTKPKLEKSDYVKSIDYYRDMLTNYSPATLSYIDNFQNDGKKYAVVTLLSLVKKEKIKIENGIIILIDRDETNLFQTEKYVLKNISEQEGKLILNRANEKETKDLSMWEDYLIYSVAFDINTKVRDEFNKIIKIKEFEL